MTPVYPASYSRLSALSFGGVTFRATAHYPRPVSGSFHSPSRGSFQLSLTVLVRYRTRDVFSLGGWCPPASRENSNPRYSGDSPHPRGLRLRGYHPLRRRIPADFGFTPRVLSGEHLQHHIHPPFREGVRFGLCRFRSPLLTASRLLSFPAGTRMFPFPAFPLPYGSAPEGAGLPIRGSRVLRLHAPPPGFSQLGTPFVGARAQPSTGRDTAEKPATVYIQGTLCTASFGHY